LLYLNDVAASVTRPNKQLKAFKKIELNPGQAENLSFTLTPYDLSFMALISSGLLSRVILKSRSAMKRLISQLQNDR